MELTTPIAIRLLLACVAILCPFQCQLDEACPAHDAKAISLGAHGDCHDHGQYSDSGHPVCPDDCAGHDCICGGALVPSIIDAGSVVPFVVFDSFLRIDDPHVTGSRIGLAGNPRNQGLPVGPAGENMRIALSCWTL